MFKKIGPNEAESSEGFVVRRTGRFELLYCEADRESSIEVEPGEGLAVYVSSIRSWRLQDGSNAQITSEERAQITKRVSEALAFLEIIFVIE